MLDAARTSALARALGATPGQATAGLALAQVLPALAAAVTGIPLGLVVFRYAYGFAGGQASEAVTPGIGWLLAVIPAILVCTAVLTAAPARRTTHRSVGPMLQFE